MVECWNTYRDHLEKVYGKRVYRIGIDGGFSCPNRDKERGGGCIYCDGTGASAIYQRTTERGFTHASSFHEKVSNATPLLVPSLEKRCASIKTQITRGKLFLADRYKAELFSAYFQAWTNTYADKDTLKTLYDCALEEGPFTEFIVSTRPDCLDDEVLDLLESYKGRVQKVWVELGLQSADDATLALIERNHTKKNYIQAVDSLHMRGIGVCTHVIIGLPGESNRQFSETARLINSVGSEAVKIHNLDVCGGTKLNDWYREGEVSVASGRRHLENCIYFLRQLKSDIVIERMICETPQHRLVAPRSFPDKSAFLGSLHNAMEQQGFRQGDFA
ncbi:TIGR01212 family radical SAM protein [uncultured Sphaerochaeta sp.]|uniref:TIGR01212 family radical SAM protein n=1 Tax=uncultured Sphaerochaeta sp. TaxID=886478 RepID=UPI002A0A6F60|nr:TIGR01212 family radical SAM protein [uncultured Sphaerochaeta sp.]